VAGDRVVIGAISRHVERYLGRIAFVFHDIVSDDLPIDVLYIRASEHLPFEMLVTSGMSALPMTTPKGVYVTRFAEVVALLPPGWPLMGGTSESERHQWPVRMIRDLARFPHEAETWFGCGHSICDSGSSPAPYVPGTLQNAILFLHSVSLPPHFGHLKRPARCEITFLAAIPLYSEELEIKLRDGTGVLVSLLRRHGITDVIDPGRPNVAPRAGIERASRARLGCPRPYRPGPARPNRPRRSPRLLN
jgi:hypothetical protein